MNSQLRAVFLRVAHILGVGRPNGFFSSEGAKVTPRVGRPLGAAGGRRYDRHPNDARAQVDHPGHSARSQLRLEPPGGKLKGGDHLVERRFPLGVEDACREHPAIHLARGQQLEQLARTQGRAVGGVVVTMDRGEEQAHGIPGEKAAMRHIDGDRFWQNEPLAIALVPSRGNQVPETLSRFRESYCKLSMSGLSAEYLAIRYKKRPARRPCQKAARGVSALTRRAAREWPVVREVASGQWSVASEGEGRELAVRERRRTKPIATGH